MILRLRSAVPLLQTLSGWAAKTPVPPVLRRAVVLQASHASTAASGDSDGSHDKADQLASGSQPEAPKKRGGSSLPKATEVEKPAAGGLAEADAYGEAGDAADATRSAQSSTSKRRSRKATTEADEQQQDLVQPAAPAKRSRRKKADAPPADADVTEEGSAGSSATVAAAPKKRSSKAAAKKTEEASSEGEQEVESYDIRGLPYEDCLVLPRKAEQVLIALGVRSPLVTPAAGNAGPSSSSSGSSSSSSPPKPADAGTPLRNVHELAQYLGWRDVRAVVPQLLVAQYQRYLGDSPDYLYDLLCLDFGEPFLSSDVVRSAVLAATRAAKKGHEVSAKGTPPEALLKAALEKLEQLAGSGALQAQEKAKLGLTAAQVELFLLDWASAKLAGLQPGEDSQGIQYLARRCAALQLTRPVVVERLHRFLRGASLQELAASTGRGSSRVVKLTQPMEALVEGLKAGVRLDRERLLQDFRLGPGAPMHGLVPQLQATLAREEARASEPGSSMFYSSIVDKIRVAKPFSEAIPVQEKVWAKEQGDDASNYTLTTAQLRLLFHMGRLDRFRAEQAKRPDANTGLGAGVEVPS
ncbi:hypothetical protein Agub_g4772 [Astrephomene gubernaculifera]|uniref:Uncharacterized protein n=1 Tax=Astrephomene gubernaculifera TaxID=47775 RepID=A0AAD3DKQ8_9CHLO|nr:hypothetical protein Agub_g4772 [Astrephomene gubernaculifera]